MARARRRPRCETRYASLAGALHHATMMDGDGGTDQIPPQPAQPRQGPLLVGAGKPAVSNHVRRKNGCEFPGLRHGSPFTTGQTSTVVGRPRQVVSPSRSLLPGFRTPLWITGVGCGAWAANGMRRRSARTRLWWRRKAARSPFLLSAVAARGCGRLSVSKKSRALLNLCSLFLFKTSEIGVENSQQVNQRVLQSHKSRSSVF
jgi:hypothetical protein